MKPSTNDQPTARPVHRPLSRDVRALVWSFTDGRCYYCGFQTNPFLTFCVDHVTPLARGGDDEIGNLVPCCVTCNSRKGARLPYEWRPRWWRTEWHKEYQERYQLRHYEIVEEIRGPDFYESITA